jgi:acyl dehydratase
MSREVSTRALSATDFARGTSERYFDDYKAGAVYEYGYAQVDEPDVINFAKRFDPQLFHIDQESAASGPFGGLIASGWHTAGIFMRLYADHYLSWVASLGSPGVDDLRWPAPVRPGDSLRLRTTVLDTRCSRSKPDRGIVRTHGELFNQKDETVLSLVVINLLLLKPRS